MKTLHIPLRCCLLGSFFLFGCAECKRDRSSYDPDPALEKASEAEKNGLAASVQYVKRERSSLVIGYKLSHRPGGGWELHPELDVRVHLWDDNDHQVGPPVVRDFGMPDNFGLGKVKSMQVQLVVPCPAKARWVAVQFGESDLQTNKVAISP